MLGQRVVDALSRVIRRNAEELAFLPATLEIVETPASPTLRLTAGAICAVLTAAVVWLCFARIDEVTVASGKVGPLGQVKVVQPLEVATIRAIPVDDGPSVPMIVRQTPSGSLPLRA